ncbi:unnamed protein product, partial [Rotaria socialis]
ETCAIGKLKNQILSLSVDIDTNEAKSLPEDGNTILFTLIFSTFTNLRYLNFGPSLLYYQRLSFGTRALNIMSICTISLIVFIYLMEELPTSKMLFVAL